MQLSDPILDIIKTDESLEFISLKEAINLLARKTNSSTFGVATYLLNKKVHILLDSHARQNNHKIEATSLAIDQDHWCGENDCFFWLNYIAENGKHYPSFSIGDNSKYNAGCQESFWKREEFFDLECIRSLNLFSTEEWNTLFQKQQYIWDTNYLNILKNDVPDLIEIDSDIYLNESINFEDQRAYQEVRNYPLFFKNDVFTVQESACLISNYDPYLVGNKSREVVWLNENPRYAEAESFIYSALRGGLFEEIEDEFYVVRAEILKTFLSSKDIFIDGFNDGASANPTNENLVENTQLKNTIANLQLDVAIEQATVKELNEEIEKLKTERLEKDQKIKELEQLNLNADSDLPDLSVEQLTGLAKRNQLAQDRQGMARIIALSFWEKDQNILIGDMADRVYRTMIDYCKDDLPQLTDTLKSWIRPVATEEAQKKGRPKSSI
ncbi:hypothetical protein QR665_00665 [Acinetobacter gerneri]|uniref:hypothetical protein n=1 Tax=Acinetobacter gerneri TaxID=202952 RepID=UPI0029365A40|nr:hypothetical protein [Acinetobacter gerneri]MDV2438019.1 hypothetical protein [Acinetobacter gerneri]